MSITTTREVDQITSLLPKLIDENTRVICTQVLISVIKLLLETHLDIDEELINSIIDAKIADLDLEINEGQVRNIVNSAISELNINDYLKESDAIDTYLKKTEIKDWAKTANKPSYNYSEIMGTPLLAAVATSGRYNDLLNKPTIPDITTFATKEELDEKFSKSLKLLVVDNLPEEASSDHNAIYLVKKNNASNDNVYDEFVIASKTDESLYWEKIGTTEVDLSLYATKTYVDHQSDIKVNNKYSELIDIIEPTVKIQVWAGIHYEESVTAMTRTINYLYGEDSLTGEAIKTAISISFNSDEYDMSDVRDELDDPWRYKSEFINIPYKDYRNWVENFDNIFKIECETEGLGSIEYTDSYLGIAWNEYLDVWEDRYSKKEVNTLLSEKANIHGNKNERFATSQVDIWNLQDDVTLYFNDKIIRSLNQNAISTLNFPNESGTLALEENTVAKSEYETVKLSYEGLVGAITGEPFDVDSSSINYGEALTNFVSNNTSVTTATNTLNDLQSQIASIATLDGDNSGTQLVARINKLVDDKGYVSTATFNDDVVASLQNTAVETAVKLAAGYDTSVNGYVQTSSNETNTYEITNTGNEIDLYHQSQVTVSGDPTTYKDTWCKITADEIKFCINLQNNALTKISAQSVVAPKFIKNNGTSELILLADGSTITIDELVARINNNS